MLSFAEQIDLIYKTNWNYDFEKIIYPYVINYEGISPWDKTDILTVIKDIDISKYRFMDTLASDYCIEICENLLKGVKK